MESLAKKITAGYKLSVRGVNLYLIWAPGQLGPLGPNQVFVRSSSEIGSNKLDISPVHRI